MNRFKKLRDFFGINPSIITMLVVVITLGLGEKLGERFLPVYLLALGGSVYAVGFLNSIDNFLTAVYAYIGGYISDKIGYKRALYSYTLIAMLGYLIIIIFPVWQAVLIGAIFFISWTALSLPAILSLISATVVREKQTMGVSLHSLTRKIPMALGPLFGGFMIGALGVETGARVSFVIAFFLGIFSLFFIRKYVEDKRKERDVPISLFRSFSIMSRELRVLLLSDILIRFAEQMPYAFVVLWVMENNGMSAPFFGVLTVIEMVTSMLIYIPGAYLSERTSGKLSISISFLFFTIFPVFLLFSKSMIMLIVAFVIRGLKEFGEPTRKALIVKLSPVGSRGSIFGSYYLYRDVIVSIAVLFSALLWKIGPGWNFVTSGIFGLCGTMVFVIFGRDERVLLMKDKSNGH